jgi:uncharacterized protein (TIGR02145 family)
MNNHIHLLYIRRIILFVIYSLSATLGINAQCIGDNTFTAATNNNWGNTGNWTAGCVPGGGQISGTVRITANCNVNNTNGANFNYTNTGTFMLADGVTFTNNGTGNWNFNNFEGNGTYIGNVSAKGVIRPGYTPPVFNCGDLLSYGGQNYETILFGSDCWMAENLNIGTMINGPTAQADNGVIEKFCYNNTASECTQNGGLYQWDEAMQYSLIDEAQGVCPNGWHVASDNDFKALEILLGMTQAQADATGLRGLDQGAEMATDAAAWTDGPLETNFPAAFGTSGFDALPAGNFRASNGTFINKSLSALYWTSTNTNTIQAMARVLAYTHSRVQRDPGNKINAFNIRCVQN